MTDCYINSELKYTCSICNEDIPNGYASAHSCIPHLLSRINKLESKLDKLYRRITYDDFCD